jgi:hypothetical protein
MLCYSIGFGATAQPFSPAPKAPVQTEQTPVQRVQPFLPTPNQAVKAGEPERVRVTKGLTLTLEQVLKKPDATVVISADGKQSTSVGEIRRRFNSRQRAIAANETGKPLTGGFARTRLPQGVKTVSLLQQSIMQEAALAQSVRSKQVTDKAFYTAQEANRSRALITPQPGIGSVNDKIRGYIVSPRNYLTIKGREFGDTVGKVNVVGSYFPTGASALRVVNWRTDEIYVLVPSEIRGVLDHEVNIQVITRANKTYRLDGGKFIAAREEIAVRTNIPRIIQFESSGGWKASMTNEGFVGRSSAGESINCPSPGMDRLRGPDRYTDPRAIFPGKGFVIVGLNASWGRTDSGNGDGRGNDGSRTFFPGYGFSEWYGKDQEIIDVKWGVWRSHESPVMFIQGYDLCSSSYQIEVVLSGPAGVAPF